MSTLVRRGSPTMNSLLRRSIKGLLKALGLSGWSAQKLNGAFNLSGGKLLGISVGNIPKVNAGHDALSPSTDPTAATTTPRSNIINSIKHSICRTRS